MKRIAIVTDSVVSIPEEIMEALDIHWVPYYIHRGKEVLRDLVTIRQEDFYQWMLTTEELPQTACPGPGDYLETYEELAASGAEEILSIHMTSKGSGAYRSARAAQSIARERLPGMVIEVVDTLNVSMCHGWMTIEAARAALAGRSMQDILGLIREMMPKTRMIQTADTLRYLYMGGRIGRAKHLVGTLLNIKPLISMEDGEIVPLGQARSRKRAYQMMAEMIESMVGRTGKIKIAYVHAAALEEAEKIRAIVESRLACVETIFAELPPALGVHTGPGTAGLCYYPVSS